MDVRVQPGEAFETVTRTAEPFALGANVENVIGVMAGRDRSAPALLVMAHYDSVPNSPGASDDAAGVASALETARALTASGPPARDVIFLITDGEEAGLIGAHAFFNDDPLAKRIGAVVNMDTRGEAGRAFMFETGKSNGQTIARFAHAVSGPSANSMASFIYSVLPNDTDFTPARQSGLQGVNFAFIGREVAYHAWASTPASLDQGSLQDMGRQVLAVTRELADAKPLPKAAPDVVYSDLLGLGPIVYPTLAGWGLLAVSLLLMGWVAAQGAKARKFTISDVLRGAGAALAATLATVPFAGLVQKLTGAGFGLVEARPLLAQFPTYEAGLALVALAVIVGAGRGLASGKRRFWLAGAPLLAALACQAFGFDPVALGTGVVAAGLAVFVFARPSSPSGSWIGVWVVVALAAVGLQVAVPTIAYVLAWPLLAASLAAALASVATRGELDRSPGLVIAAVIGAVAAGQIAYAAHALVVGAGSFLPGAIAPFVLLALLVLTPLARALGETRAAGLAAAGAIVLALGLGLFIRLHPYASPETPRATEVLAVADSRTWTYSRVAPLPGTDPWTDKVLKADGGAITQGDIPILSSRPVRMTKASTFEFDDLPIAVFWRNEMPTLIGRPQPSSGMWGFEFMRPGLHAPNYQGRLDARLKAEEEPINAGKPPSDPAPTELSPTIELMVPAGNTQNLRLEVKSSATVADVRVDGKPVALMTMPGQWSYLAMAAPKDGIVISFTPKAHGTLEARWAAYSPGWPKSWKPLPPRPADAMPWSLSDSSVVLGSIGPGEAKF